MDPEFIIRVTYQQVIKFLKNVLGTNKMMSVVKHLNESFPKWSDFWSTVHEWLKEHPLTNMQHSIHSFAQLFPNYKSFAEQLDQSLELHDEFWNQVHKNLCYAKGRLAEC